MLYLGIDGVAWMNRFLLAMELGNVWFWRLLIRANWYVQKVKVPSKGTRLKVSMSDGQKEVTSSLAENPRLLRMRWLQRYDVIIAADLLRTFSWTAAYLHRRS